ncbi:MAG: hypothetical protein WAV89_01940 [Ignavibacteriaceae bacterium]
MIEVLLDENLSEYVAQALNFLNKGYFKDIQVLSTKEKFGKGVTDEILIPSIAQTGGILITRDFSIHKTRLQYDLCKQYELGVFFLRLPKNQDKHWEIVKSLVNHWEEIIGKIYRDKKPFAFRVPIKGQIEKL